VLERTYAKRYLSVSNRILLTRSANPASAFYLSCRKKMYIGVKTSSKIIMTRAMRTTISVCLSLADGKTLPKSCEIDVTSTSRKRIAVG
jgi:hypothetical protein